MMMMMTMMIRPIIIIIFKLKLITLGSKDPEG